MRIKIKLFILVFLIAACSIIFYNFSFKKDEKSSFQIDKNLDEYKLRDHTGKLFTHKVFSDTASLFFFGFLNCPDICPMTLTKISEIIRELKEDKELLKFFFVTVDPVRDTEKEMKEYLEQFDKKIIGITGNKKNIHDFLEHMYVYYKKVKLSQDVFTFDHSSQIFLFDKKGKFFGTISLEEDITISLEKIKSII
tara:strand:+ start:554 stop:1138 length:585 start_codon:yes stop_codon:yes gene_type:complete